MKCAIMQPTFNPWLGLFDMIDKVDTFIFYNDVQLTKRSWQVRNKILTPNGELFLTIPIKKTVSRENTNINIAEIDYDQKWVDQHLKSLAYNYSKAQFYKIVYSFISDIYNSRHPTLASFNQTIISEICKIIGITTPLVESDSLSSITGAKDDRLVSICKAIEANQYLSAAGSSIYIEAEQPGGMFPQNNIDLYYHKYNHPTYRQITKDIFVPYIGIFDLLFNEGFEFALDVIRGGREQDYTHLEYRKIMGKDE